MSYSKSIDNEIENINKKIHTLDTKNLEEFTNFIIDNDILSYNNLLNISNTNNSNKGNKKINLMYYILSKMSRRYLYEVEYEKNNIDTIYNKYFCKLLNHFNIQKFTDSNIKKFNKKNMVYVSLLSITKKLTPACIIFYIIENVDKNFYNLKLFITLRGTSNMTDVINISNVKKKELILFSMDDLVNINKDINKLFENKIENNNKLLKPKIHGGFLSYFRNIIKVIYTDITKFILSVSKYNNKKILKNSAYITGHSLGGVLSLLSGIILSIGNINTYVITFGQPRVGNDDFNKLLYMLLNNNTYFKKYIRFYNKNDIIVSIPTRIYSNGFKHLDNFIDINKLNKLNKYEHYNIQDDTLNDLLLKLNNKFKFKLAHSGYIFKNHNKTYLIY